MRYAKTDYGRQLASLQIQKGIKETMSRAITKAFDSVKFDLRKANALSSAVLDTFTKSLDNAFSKIDLDLKNITVARDAPSNIVSRAIGDAMNSIYKSIQDSVDAQLAKASEYKLNTTKINDAIQQANIAKATGSRFADSMKNLSSSLDRSLTNSINQLKEASINKIDPAKFFAEQKGIVSQKIDRANLDGGNYARAMDLGTSVPELAIKDAVSKSELDAGLYTRFNDANRIGLQQLDQTNIRGGDIRQFDAFEQNVRGGEAKSSFDSARQKGFIDLQQTNARNNVSPTRGQDPRQQVNQSQSGRQMNSANTKANAESGHYGRQRSSDIANSQIAQSLPQKIDTNLTRTIETRKLDNKAKLDHALATRPIDQGQLGRNQQLNNQVNLNTQLYDGATVRSNLEAQSFSRYGDINSSLDGVSKQQSEWGNLSTENKRIGNQFQTRSSQGLFEQANGLRSLSDLDASLRDLQSKSSGIDPSTRPGRGQISPLQSRAKIGTKLTDIEVGKKVQTDKIKSTLTTDIRGKVDLNAKSFTDTRKLETMRNAEANIQGQKIQSTRFQQDLEGRDINTRQDLNNKSYQDTVSKNRLDADGYARFGDINKVSADNLKRADGFGEKMGDINAAKKADLEAKRKAAMNKAEIDRLDLQRELELKNKMEAEKLDGERAKKKMDEDASVKKKKADKDSKDAEGKRKLEEERQKKKLEEERLKKMEQDELKKKKSQDAERDKLKKKESDGKSKLDRVKDWFEKLLKVLGLAGGLFFLLGKDTTTTAPDGTVETTPPPPLDLSKDQSKTDEEKKQQEDDQKRLDEIEQKTTETEAEIAKEPTKTETNWEELLKKGITWFFALCIAWVILSYVYRRAFKSDDTVNIQIQTIQ